MSGSAPPGRVGDSLGISATSRPVPTEALPIWVVSILVLFLGFHANTWHAAESRWFETHQRDTESLVVGRMVKSRQDGLFSAGGLTGAGTPDPHGERREPARLIEDQYSAYLDGGRFERYSPYLSQTGGQAIVFSALDRSIPLAPRAKLALFHGLTALLTAVALTAIVGWFHLELGRCVAMGVLASMVLSQWLTVFGRNLWWSLWAFYLPMIAVMYFLRRHRNPTERTVWFGVVIFGSVFVKCFINGYEYLTTTLVMMLVPGVYRAVEDRWRADRLLESALAAGIGAGAALFSSLILLCVQIGSVRTGFLDGVQHVFFTLAKRTHGDPHDFPAAFADSLDASTWIVVITYLTGSFADLTNYLPVRENLVSDLLLQVRYAYLVLLFLGASVFVLLRGHDRRRDVALVAATWAAFLAPLSWHVIFKAHSYIHTHMNHVLWQMPFTFFGFGLCARALERASRPPASGSGRVPRRVAP